MADTFREDWEKFAAEVRESPAAAPPAGDAPALTDIRELKEAVEAKIPHAQSCWSRGACVCDSKSALDALRALYAALASARADRERLREDVVDLEAVNAVYDYAEGEDGPLEAALRRVLDRFVERRRNGEHP